MNMSKRNKKFHQKKKRKKCNNKKHLPSVRKIQRKSNKMSQVNTNFVDFFHKLKYIMKLYKHISYIGKETH